MNVGQENTRESGDGNSTEKIESEFVCSKSVKSTLHLNAKQAHLHLHFNNTIQAFSVQIIR